MALSGKEVAWRCSYEMRVARALWEGGSAERIVEDFTSPHEWRLHRARYDYAAQFVVGRRVVDFACGSGYGTARLAQAGAQSAHGFDRDRDAICYADLRYARSHPHLSLEYGVGEASAMLRRDSYDVAVSFETIEHVPDPEALLSNFCQALTSDGICLISTPIRAKGTLQSPVSNPHHLREWSHAEFVALCEKYFNTIESQLLQGLRPRRGPNSQTTRHLARGLKRTLNGLGREIHNQIESALLPIDDYDARLWTAPTYLVLHCANPKRTQ